MGSARSPVWAASCSGIFWLVPFIETVSTWIDRRTTTTFAAEQTLTSDTVPVNVDAVLFWMVHDAQKAALEVQDYQQAVSWAAQTALRDIIGRTALADLLRGREQVQAELQQLIDERSNPWGVTVSSVEMRRRQSQSRCRMRCRAAQASREKQARIILVRRRWRSPVVSKRRSHCDNPTALQLRAIRHAMRGMKGRSCWFDDRRRVDGHGRRLGAAAMRQEAGRRHCAEVAGHRRDEGASHEDEHRNAQSLQIC